MSRAAARQVQPVAERPPEPVFAAARALARLLAAQQDDRTTSPPAAPRLVVSTREQAP